MQVYVPILPVSMIDMTDSPVPWLMGTHVLNVGRINFNHNPGELPTQVSSVCSFCFIVVLFDGIYLNVT